MAIKLSIPTSPSDFWDWLLLRRDVVSDIEKQGYHIVDKFEMGSRYKEWGEKEKERYRSLGIHPLEYRIPSLSVDFISQLPRVLDTNDLYTIPVGRGDCAIFDSNVFPAPYLKLNGLDWDATKISVRRKNGFRNLVDSLSVHWNEQTFIRALHFCGSFKTIVKSICKSDDYERGPCGHLPSHFPFWMKTRRKKLVPFTFEGMVDLDECLYPRDSDVVIPIEAKIDNGHAGLSWHKLAFPAYRFIDNSKAFGTFRTGSSINGIYSKVKIVPVYCLFSTAIKTAYIYVFPPIATVKSFNYDCPEYGIVLNDADQMTPQSVFEVRMDWL